MKNVKIIKGIEVPTAQCCICRAVGIAAVPKELAEKLGSGSSMDALRDMGEHTLTQVVTRKGRFYACHECATKVWRHLPEILKNDGFLQRQS